jgi:assimilatory nitrate reductase catalytic subunit
VSLPDTTFTREALDKLEFYAVIDFFLSETAFHADLVLPGSLHEEDEGTSTNVEGRVIKLNPSKTPPGNARLDWEILCDIARRLGKERYFPYTHPEEMFDELRVASKGGSADYFGITWDRIEQELGVFWPCPAEDHPGTKRLFEGGRFYTDDERGRFNPVRYRPPAEVVDDEYPVWLTTGRVVSQYLSGTQTRRIGPLVAQYPEPMCELHPDLAGRHGIATGDTVRVSSRRGTMTLPAKVVSTIRPDTIFIPYHWAGKRAANRLTNRALDPLSKIPEFKVCAVRIERIGAVADESAGGVGGVVDAREMELVEGDARHTREVRGDEPRQSPSEPGEGGG